MTGWAIIGCGMIAKFHAKAIAELKGSKLVACHSRSIDKANEFAAAFGGTGYSDLRKMLANPAVDVVTICTPSGAHLEPGLEAARAGKHVLVEKPLEVTTARCDKLIEACSKAGVQLGTIFPSRFHKSAQLMKSAAEQGRFGTISLAAAYVKWFRTQAYYDSGLWRGTWELDGGGALMNQAIHSVDLLLWLMGPVKSVSAMTALRAHERIEVEDAATAILEFDSGALGTIEATTAAYPGTLKRIEIAGALGSATLEEEAIKQWSFSKAFKSDAKILEQMTSNVTGGGAADPAAIGHKAHRDLFANFLHGIKKGLPCSIDGLEGRRSVELITSIYKAAKRGTRIRF
ncbi:MAG: Gfo/Idh/MocA family oxidoreductase [Planctomycetota bacterium]|nr:Gfo/Idh/MocA family oxidoreductase [Planctomycetota bacterium]